MTRRRPRVHLQALGCRLNEAELGEWAGSLRGRGWQILETPEAADLVVINTCAVTREAARKSRQLLRRARRENPQARLVVTGCQATLDPEAARLAGADRVLENEAKDTLPDRVAELVGDTDPAPGEAARAEGLWARSRDRAFVKIQDGCRHRCTYCIVTIARGAERSRDPEAIVAEVQAYVAAGIQEVVLTGVHVGGYGSDRGLNLAGLVQRLLDRTALPRLRLASVEPWDLPDDLLACFQDPRLQPHLHLPIQSGSDRLLRRMGRRGRTADYAERIATLRAQVPHFNVTTDVIVGFPGETAADWAATLDFVEHIGFGHLHLFGYSPRAGTPAADWPNTVSPPVRRARQAILHDRGRAHKHIVLTRLCGTRQPVLIEGEPALDAQGTPWLRGYTPQYARVRFPAAADWVRGDRVDIALHRVDRHRDELVGSVAGSSDR